MLQPDRWRPTIGVVAGTLLLAVVAFPGPAQAASADESRVFSLSNSLRSSGGLPALVLSESLSAVARGWAVKMAAAGTISHNPDLASQVTGWSKLAENVGMGPDIDTVHRALVASRPHYANLTDPAMTLMGVGVVTVGGTVFIVENFMRPSGAAPPAVAPTVPPAAPPTTAPRPAVTTPKPTATTVVRAPAPSTTAAPAPGTTAAPATGLAGAPPAIAADPPSPWLAMALEMTRSWAGTAG